MSQYSSKLPPSGLGLGLAQQRTTNTTQPMNMRNYNTQRTNVMGSGPMMASSAPVYDQTIHQLPRAPLPKPRTSVAEPPPMSLPPSPPIFAPVQHNVNKTNKSRDNTTTYSRSLSNQAPIDYLSASMPAHMHTQHNKLDNVWSQNERIDETDEIDTEKPVSDYMDDIPPAGRLGRQTSAQTNKQQLSHTLDTAQLGTSPTVFSLLSGKPNSYIASHSYINNKHSVPQHTALPSSRAQPQQQSQPQQHTALAAPVRSSNADDELQFDINLDDQDDKDDEM